MQRLFNEEPESRDGVWDTAEIEAIYGVHHVYSQKKSKVRIHVPISQPPRT